MSRVVLLVGALTVLAHLPGVLAPEADFVYDDVRFIRLNEDVRHLRAPWAYLDPETVGPDGAGIYRPLRTLSFAVDHALFGESVRPWRLESVLLHGVAAALVALFLQGLGFGRPGVLVGGLVFGFHPVTAEVSSWLSSRGDVLALIAALAAARLHLSARPVAAAIAFGLGLLGKEMVITLPLLLFIVDAARGARPLRSRGSRVAYAWLAGAGLGYLALRFAALGSAFGQQGIDSWFPARARGFLHEVLVTVLPVGLGFDRRFVGSTAAVLGVLIVLAALVGAATLLWRRGARLAAAGLLWFPVALVPVSVLPLNIATADRFLYVSLVGVAMVAADLATRIRPRTPVVVPAVAAIVLLGVLGGARTLVYASPASLWREAARVDPDNIRAVEGFAYDAYAHERYREAAGHFDRFLEQVPEDAKAHLFLARTFRMLGREAEASRGELFGAALAEYREAIELWRGGAGRGREIYLARACHESARLALAVGDPGRAEADARAAVEEGVGKEGLAVLLHVVSNWLEIGRMADAERAARALLALDPRASPASLDHDLRGWLGPRALEYDGRLRDLARRLR